MPLVKRKTLQERFEAKITIDPYTGCWNWNAGLNFHLGGSCGGDARPQVASLMIYKGLVKLRLRESVYNACNNDKCVNPDHLEIRDKYVESIAPAKRKGTKIVNEGRESVDTLVSALKNTAFTFPNRPLIPKKKAKFE